jgi:hypothetical protein
LAFEVDLVTGFDEVMTTSKPKKHCIKYHYIRVLWEYIGERWSGGMHDLRLLLLIAFT